MRVFTTFSTIAIFAALAALVPGGVRAQTAINLDALQGLAPFSALLTTPAGRAALAANYAVTGAIQTGTANQPGLQSFELQREQALKDAFITFGNAFDLADGLGTKLGGAYQSATSYTSVDDGASSTFTNISSNVATLIGYTFALTSSDAASGKFFFANATVVAKSGARPVSSEAAAILTKVGGTTDVLGQAYHRPAGSAGADPYGDSRPFQTESSFVKFSGTDYFGVTASNDNYLEGPIQSLVSSPSFPSGHTTYGYTESLLLALLVPQRFPQMIVRGAEYGNSRIVLGAHYAMDVIAGRTLAYYDVAHLLAENPAYIGQQNGAFSIAAYRTAVDLARGDVTKTLTAGCGETVMACAAEDTSRFGDIAKNDLFYTSTQTYGLPVVFQAMAQRVEDVASLAPDAGYILTTAFPNLTLAEADAILTKTEGPGGGFLDNGSGFGVYSRLDLYKAGKQAATLSAGRPGHNL